MKQGILKKLFIIIKNALFTPNWKCLLCEREIFDKDKYFCEDCEKQLPFNDGPICAHCGRKVIAPERYCTTCKGYLVSLDLSRSCFSYEKPIDKLIKNAKYAGKQYLLDYFAQRLALLYLKNYFNADGFIYIPMTKRAERKRGYNQSKILAQKLSESTNVPLLHCVDKVKETKRQATLSRAERLKNLEGAFKVVDKGAVKDKTLVIVDDVTTTGSTAEIIAKILKKAGAEKVYLVTVASTPPIDKY